MAHPSAHPHPLCPEILRRINRMADSLLSRCAGLEAGFLSLAAELRHRHPATEAAVSPLPDGAVHHLQAGDFMRQKTEHIAAALHAAGRRLAEALTAAEFGPCAAEVEGVLVIQAGQLGSLRHDAETALARLWELLPAAPGNHPPAGVPLEALRTFTSVLAVELAELAALREQLRPWRDPTGLAGQDHSHLLGHYTMPSEREVHRRIFAGESISPPSGTGDDPTGQIELFHDEPSPRAQA